GRTARRKSDDRQRTGPWVDVLADDPNDLRGPGRARICDRMDSGSLAVADSADRGRARRSVLLREDFPDVAVSGLSGIYGAAGPRGASDLRSDRDRHGPGAHRPGRMGLRHSIEA